MDLINRSPDEVKEREFETTGYREGTDLPSNADGKPTENNESGSKEINEKIEPSDDINEESGISSINTAMEEGADILPKDNQDNQTLGIP